MMNDPLRKQIADVIEEALGDVLLSSGLSHTDSQVDKYTEMIMTLIIKAMVAERKRG